MTVLDEAIRDALTKVGVAWYPFYISDKQIVLPRDFTTPACIQEVEDEWKLLDNGSVMFTIKFYMFSKRKKELNVTTIMENVMPLQRSLTELIMQFVMELNRSDFRVRLIGTPTKSHDNLAILDVGQDFTLTIETPLCRI